jgi:hypothetical protein
MSLYLQPVRLAAGSRDEESELVLAGHRLVAVLVRLSEAHGAGDERPDMSG